jgi:DNA polymerase-1
MEKKIVLAIDFNNFLFGSYYGEKLINSNGINVNAVKGFFLKLRSLNDIFDPDYVVFANDLSRTKTFRRKLYKPYKAQRKPQDTDISTQMRIASSIAVMMGYQFNNNELYEADDILGMIAKLSNENDMICIIVSTDRDLYQLINENTYIYNHRNKEIIDNDVLMERYHLTPEQWIELKMLQGDRSDNIPGIPGIGEVTALQLMQQFGSIDGIYNNLTKIKPKPREILINNKNVLPLTRELVTIITDYTKINLTLDDIKCIRGNKEDIYNEIKENELFSLYYVVDDLLNSKSMTTI